MDDSPQPCRFAEAGCPDRAIAEVEMAGCACYPDDAVQLLCLQHLHESEPLGHWRVARWLDGEPPAMPSLQRRR